MSQYSKRMVIVHWLVFGLVIAAWFLGESVHDARHDKVATILGYVIHASVGGTVFLLALSQLYFRRKDGVPPSLADTPIFQAVSNGVKYSLYAMLVLLPASGMMQIATSDLGKALLANDATMLPSKFEGVFAHEAHEILVSVLIALVALHILGAVKHQFIMKDGLMSRMSLRRKS